MLGSPGPGTPGRSLSGRGLSDVAWNGELCCQRRQLVCFDEMGPDGIAIVFIVDLFSGPWHLCNCGSSITERPRSFNSSSSIITINMYQPSHLVHRGGAWTPLDFSRRDSKLHILAREDVEGSMHEKHGKVHWECQSSANVASLTGDEQEATSCWSLWLIPQPTGPVPLRDRSVA